jgi:uncharacterized cupredoxin-like copper-binding protein
VKPVHRRNLRLIVTGALAAMVLGAGSTVALAAASGAFRGSGRVSAGAGCAAPALPGAVVDVRLVDMGAGMMGGPAWRGPMTGGRQGMGVFRILASPDVVPAGTVSLRVRNAGALTHELVVLPLPAGQAAGARTAGADGRIDETGSLGEASRTCGAGEGDGISAGATGWVTLRLQPGHYELVCNLPRHYAAGMYTELDVS